MFSNCINLVDYPIFTILNAEAIYMIGMFSDIKNHTNGKTKKFDNFKKWIIKASNRSSVAVFDDMFKGTDFSSFDLKEIICFGDNGSIDLSIIDKGYWRFKQMFMDTYNEKPYKINLHIKTDDKSNHPDGTLEHFVDLVDGIFDEHNMNNGGVYGIYSTSTNPSLLYNYLEEQYKDTEYFNNGSIKTIK
jgi:hypothetical protein